MTFNFNSSIPAANNDPSVDQPDMLLNNQSTESILAVDHISFNEANGGNHLQVHLPSFTNPAVVNGTATQGSVVYSAAGSTDTANAQLYFKNNLNIALGLSFIKAFAAFTGSTGAFIGNPYNVVSVSAPAGNSVYTVTLPVNLVSGTNYVVIPTVNGNGTATQSVAKVAFLSATQFTLQIIKADGTGFFSNSNYIAFIVLQI